MKRIMIITAMLAAISLSLQAGPKVEMKTSGPSGQGNPIWWAPSTGITNLVMTTNGITVLTAAPGSAVVWTNASLTITRQAVASATNATATSALTMQRPGAQTPTITVTKQTASLTNVVDGVTNVFVVVTNVTAACSALLDYPTNATAAVTVTVERAAVAAVTNVALSNP
jgi:hypothetical protein